MTATAIKHAAQDELMQGLANAILVAEETGAEIDIINEMRVQAARVGKMFGYSEWPGIMHAGKPICVEGMHAE